MLECSKCGAKSPDKAKFCCECGEKLEIKAFCPQCGNADIGNKMKFFPQCGFSFHASDSEYKPHHQLAHEIQASNTNNLSQQQDFEWLMIDATHCKVHPHAAGARGGNQGMGRTKGGSTAKYIWPWMRMVCQSELLPLLVPQRIAAKLLP